MEQSISSLPVGVFDSGLGGLTTVKSVIEQLPHENIIYFGDTARVPYGDKSKETIVEYARQDIRFLLSFGVKAICIACNTADAMARPEMEAEFSLPIIGAVAPAAGKAVRETKNKKIGVIGTTATVLSGAYKTEVNRLDPACAVFQKACPLLVPLVEEGRFRPGDAVVESVLRDYLLPLAAEGIDTLVLGCTHYPLLYDAVASILPGVNIICSGAASTEALAAKLAETGLRNDQLLPGTHRFFVSDAPERFSAHGSLFLGMPVEALCEKAQLQ